MRIELIEADRQGAFRAFDDDGHAMGSTVFARGSAHAIVVLHTGVEDHARGHGVGKALFAHLVRWARENETKITPNCPFMRRMFHEHPETEDVLR